MLEIQRSFLENVKPSSHVNIIRSKVSISSKMINTTLEVFLKMTVPDVEKYNTFQHQEQSS